MPEQFPVIKSEGFAKPMLPARKDPKAGRTEISPSRPPISPITPSATLAKLASAPAPIHPPLSPQFDGVQELSSQNPPPKDAAARQQEGETHDQHSADADPNRGISTIPAPQPVEFDEEENTDVAAVRAALAILHHQKQKSERDIKTLQTLKRSLRQDPARFTEELVAGRLREERMPDDPLHATFPRNVYEEADEDDMDHEVSAESRHDTSSYPKIPSKQNVVRCPPVNWNKYHIVGKPLDLMHEEQRKRPSEGQPSSGPILQAGNPFHTPSSAASGPPAPLHHIYKPYDPFSDSVQSGSQRDGVQTRRSTKMP